MGGSWRIFQDLEAGMKKAIVAIVALMMIIGYVSLAWAGPKWGPKACPKWGPKADPKVDAGKDWKWKKSVYFRPLPRVYLTPVSIPR